MIMVWLWRGESSFQKTPKTPPWLLLYSPVLKYTLLELELVVSHLDEGQDWVVSGHQSSLCSIK